MEEYNSSVTFKTKSYLLLCIGMEKRQQNIKCSLKLKTLLKEMVAKFIACPLATAALWVRI
jgi:hypothetical protein